MEIINLYNGYDGYPEIILTEVDFTGQELLEVHLLAFHFDSILSNIPIGVYDRESVMYNYLTSQGWFDEGWKCTRLQEFKDQLDLLSNVIVAELLEVYNALIQICNSALQNGNRLYIILD